VLGCCWLDDELDVELEEVDELGELVDDELDVELEEVDELDELVDDEPNVELEEVDELDELVDDGEEGGSDAICFVIRVVN